MIKLNDESIVVGQIKQLLHNFNLPQCFVGDEHKHNGQHFIYNNELFYCAKNNDINIEHYKFGKAYLNLTDNLPIENNIYDRTTHRYLGRYLRFIKNVKHIDLMSLYNCFDSHVNDRELKFTINGQEKYFDGVAKGDTVYSIPIELGETYTIYIDSDRPLEMCASLDIETNSNNISSIAELAQKTFTRRVCSQRFLYTNLVDLTLTETAKNLVNQLHTQLRLLIKVPEYYDKSIIVLEGNYKDDYLYNNKIENYLYKVDDKIYNAGFVTNPQLISYLNSSHNFLLADKLIEYLTGNAITCSSEFYDIRKVQKQLNRLGLPYSDDSGIWTERETNSLKQFIYQKDLINEYDMLPYCDKTVETAFEGDMI